MVYLVDVSVDLETWDNRPGGDVRSIGACVFDPRRGWADAHVSGMAFYVACNNPLQGSYSPDFYTQKDLDKLDYSTGDNRKYRLKRDARTVDWWYEQPPEAQAAFSGTIDLKDALLGFSAWLAALGVNPRDPKSCRLWSHGAAYDSPILSEVYHIVGLPVPWHYRAPRDTRTTFDDAGIEDHTEWMKMHQLGTFHHALDDARSQAWAICDSHQRIRVSHCGGPL